MVRKGKPDLDAILMDCKDRFRGSGGFWCRKRDSCPYKINNLILADEGYDQVGCGYFDSKRKKYR